MAQKKFGETAVKLARNPLGIIALCFVFIEAIAGYLYVISSHGHDRTILLGFVVIFPLITFASFLYLVIQHPETLYGPGDYKDQGHFVALIERRIKSSPTVQRLGQNVAELQQIERANVLVYQALTLFDEKNYSGALHYLDEALKLNPNHRIALVKKSACLKRLNDFEGALKIVDDVLHIEPDLEVALYNRACYKALLGRSKDDVLTDLRRAIFLFPENKRFARNDSDFSKLRDDPDFVEMTNQ